jgi:predicted tellurium resistance membrane protein TerC
MCALGFGGFVAARAGASAAVDWYTAWLIEQSLSIDNIFVFVVVFAALGILPSLGVIVAVRGGAIARSLRCPANARPAAR